MRDEHFYTRAINLSQNENSGKYYFGRAEFYCIEKRYDEAYKDFLEAKRQNIDITQSSYYKTCMDYIEADNNIEELTKKIAQNQNCYELYILRAGFYLLKRQYDKAIEDSLKATRISPSPETFKFLDETLDKIREYNVYDAVINSNKKDLINAYKIRINLAKEKILLWKYKDYWQKRAELDLDKIIELSKDKALAIYLKVNFYEDINNKGNAIMHCKKALEQSKERKDKQGQVLTYLYATKLISLYANEENYDKALKIAYYYPDKPKSEDLKKGLKYINAFARMQIDVTRDNIRKYLKNIED